MRAFVVMVLAIAAVPHAAAQTLRERLFASPTSTVRMSFAAREGVCGSAGEHRLASGIRVRGAGEDWQPDCEQGPVRVQLAKQGDDLSAIRAYVGGSWRPRDDVTDLGEVPAEEASALLLDLAATAAPAVAEDAILPAVIAAVPDPWPRLLELARQESLHTRVRKQAIFWLGQSAAREATRGLAALVAAEETTELQTSAVFALSRREDPERIEQLIAIARTHRNAKVVRAAFFWLADSESEQAVALFEEVLLDR